MRYATSMTTCKYTLYLPTLIAVAHSLFFRPSCSYALRQQWQALSLRLRFGVFHVKRRLRRKTI